MTLETEAVDGAGMRSRRRYRRAAVTYLSSLAVQGVALAVLAISTPLALAYLGQARFGLWMTALAAADLLTFAMLGLDKGLLNALAAADGRGERAGARRLVSTAFAILASVAGALAVVFAGIYAFVPWARLLNAPAGTAAGPLLAVLAGCGLIGLLTSLVDTIQSAYQEGFRSAFWKAVGRVLGLAALVLAIERGASLPWLALAFAGAPLLAALANAALLFGRERPWLAPRLAAAETATARSLLGAGSLFFFAQLGFTLAYYIDNLIVAQLFGSAAVAAYAVTARLFDVPGMLLLLLGSALWPPLAEAIARGETEWAEHGFRRLLVASLALAAAGTLPLIFAGRAILQWWVGGAIAPPPSLFVAFGLFWLVSALTQPVGVYLGAARALGFQLGSVAALALGGLALKLLLAAWLGVPGVAWGRVVAELLFLGLPYALFLPRLKRRLSADARRGATSPAAHRR